MDLTLTFKNKQQQKQTITKNSTKMKTTMNTICLVMLGSFYRCTSGEMETPTGNGLLLAQEDTTEVLVFKDSGDDLHEIATADLVTNRSFANAGAANAALGAGKLWFNTTSKAISISE